MVDINTIIVIILLITFGLIIFKILQFISSLITDYSAGSNAVSKPVWKFISSLLKYIIIIIIIGITFLWLIWLIFTSIGFGVIINVVPPFPQLTEAGVFQLWSDIVASIIELSPTGIIRAFITFFITFSKYAGTTLNSSSSSKSNTKVVSKKGGDSKKDKKKPNKNSDTGENTEGNTIVKSKITKFSSETPEEETEDQNKIEEEQINDPTTDQTEKEEEEEEEEEEEKQTNPNATEESKYTAEEHKAVQTKVDMCIAENSIPTDSSMDMIEKLKASVHNNKVALMCQAQSFGQYNSIRNYK